MTTAGIAAAEAARDEEAILPRSEIEERDLRCGQPAPRPYGEKERLSVRQQERVPVAELSLRGVRRGQRDRTPAFGGDAGETGVVGQRVDDRVAGRPGRRGGHVGIGERHRASSGERNLLQLVVGDESHEPAVGRQGDDPGLTRP